MARALLPLTTTVEQRAELLDGTPLGKDLAWSELIGVATFMRSLRAEPGATLFAEGDRQGRLWVVAAGTVSIQKADSDGNRKEIATVGAGRMLGEMGLVDGAPASASAVAATEVTALVLTRDDFDTMTERPPFTGVKLLRHIARLLSQRLRQTSGALVDRL